MSRRAGPVARSHVLVGFGYAFGAYLLYAVGDAAAKWLVGSLPIWQVLFLRSVLGLLLCLALGGRAAVRALAQLPRSGHLIGMNLANFGGWVAYYAAAVSLPLPQLYTSYYLSPILAALLAGPMLRERIAPLHWIAAALGFLGVLITISPFGGTAPALLPALLGVGAAALWALSAVLYRRNVHGNSNLELLVFSNITIGGLSAIPLAFTWQPLDLHQGAILLVVGVAALGAHFLYINGVRRVAVGAMAPVVFFSLIWSALLGYLIWGDVPSHSLMEGGACILLAGLVVVAVQWRDSRPGPSPSRTAP